MNQITELAARLASTDTEEEARSVDLAIYHARRLMQQQQHEMTLNLLLAQIATLKELHDADDDKLRALERQAEAKLEPFEAVEEAA